ncbi:S49 family peptidase [Escherichia coli]|nr:S49 family peptidase [Escherichia coli]
MTAELRNLPHIASMAFNEPLMLEPAYARVFFCALAGQLGISRLTDAVSGDSLTAQEALATLALSGDDDGPRQARSYQVMNGIAVLPVSGTLVSRTRALQPYSGMTGYNGIIARLQQAASDPMVDGILLDMDTPGGMVAGAFDCADIIARVRDIKPVWALANDMNCSAGQLLASAASRRLVTQTARTGSIGVMMAHSNYGAALEKQGVEITLIYSGSHKVDGNPYSHLPDDRGDLPVIKLGNARVVLSRRRRRKKGQRSSLKGGGSVLVVGNRRIPGAFIQQLKNGRWHVMQRVAGKNRYPIDVVKIPMAVPLTTAFKQNIERIRRERLPKELGYALQHQLRMVIKR